MTNEKGSILVKLSQVQRAPQDLKKSGITTGPLAELVVKDNGCGMEPHVLEHIFEPYFTKRDIGKGSGLGLSVVHGIVKSCGGSIQVDSTPGKGTEFRVYFPVVRNLVKAQNTCSGKESPKQLKASTEGKERILFVDDEAALVKLHKKGLERYGYEVTGTTSSKEALKLFSASPYDFDLIITDQTMPYLSGAELATSMLKIRADIPIILCTGFSYMVTEENAEELGIKKFLLKPVGLKNLHTNIREIIDVD
jgi:CheY-like chemotaxis protein